MLTISRNFLAAASLTALGGVISTCSSDQNKAAVHQVDVDSEFRDTANKILREQVKNQLKDPESAQFRHTELFHTVITEKDGRHLPGGVYTLCGEINAKNSFGGYVGYRQFISSVFLHSTDRNPADGTSFTYFDDSERNHDIFLKRYRINCNND